MPQTAYKEMGLYRAKIMILLHIAIIPQITQKDNSVTFSLIVIMPQIIYKRVLFPFILLAFFSHWLSRIMYRYRNMSTLVICLNYSQISLGE